MFRKVTGLTLQDFDLLVSLGVFNRELMNDAVYKFKRYEDSSLVYTGINTHEGENVGGFDTVLSAETYEAQRPALNLDSMDAVLANVYPVQSQSGTTDGAPEESSSFVSSAAEQSANESPSSEPWLTLQVGDPVTHKTFGEGAVTLLDGRYMKVQFAFSEKKFLFPSCFEQGFFLV